MNVVEISGVRYIKAGDAAKRVGYTTDYVGQLARAGKIEAQQIGRAWYVKEDDILGHKNGNARSNKLKTQEELHKTLENTPVEHAIYNSISAPTAYMPEYRKRLLDTHITYEQDKSPLTLSLRDENTPHHLISEELEVTADAEEDKLHTHKLGRELTIEMRSELSTLHAQRVPEPPMHGTVSIKALENDVVAEREETEQVHKENSKPAEPLSRFEERLLKSAVESPNPYISEIEKAALPREPVPQLTFIPTPVPGPRRPLSLGFRFITALTPIALLIAIAFTCSTIFLNKVIVYQKGQGSTTKSFLQTSYGVTEVATVRAALSR